MRSPSAKTVNRGFSNTMGKNENNSSHANKAKPNKILNLEQLLKLI
jgi:hypothetical protein